jgi:S-adenosylmethionine decarboxylase
MEERMVQIARRDMPAHSEQQSSTALTGCPQHADGMRARNAVRRRPLPADGFDGFVERDGLRFAGTHLIVDLWHASNLADVQAVETALRRASEAAGATLLQVDLHCFPLNGGITGVALLAESHISIHTWPECSFAAIDVFMCGRAEPHKAIEVLRGAFAPGMLSVSEHRRGVVP